MGALLGTVGILSMLFACGALIKPEPLKKFFKEKTRTKIALTFGLGGFILLIIGVAITPTQNAAAPAPTSTASAIPMTDQQKITQAVSSILSGNANTGEPYLRNLNATTSPDGMWDVLIDFNADQNLTAGLELNGIKAKSTDVYQALYTSGVNNLEEVIISAYLPGTDRYGNPIDVLIYRSQLDNDVADKVIWNADKATLELQILPGLWNTIWVSPELE